MSQTDSAEPAEAALLSLSFAAPESTLAGSGITAPDLK